MTILLCEALDALNKATHDFRMGHLSNGTFIRLLENGIDTIEAALLSHQNAEPETQRDNWEEVPVIGFGGLGELRRQVTVMMPKEMAAGSFEVAFRIVRPRSKP